MVNSTSGCHMTVMSKHLVQWDTGGINWGFHGMINLFMKRRAKVQKPSSNAWRGFLATIAHRSTKNRKDGNFVSYQ